MQTVVFTVKGQITELRLRADGQRRARSDGRASARKPRMRGDALPETTRYRDDGCDIHPACLTCPLPRCRYEEPGGLRAVLNERRDKQMVQLRLRGVPVEELAGRFGVSRRTVFRVISGTGGRPTTRALRDFEPARAGQPIPIRPREAREEANCA